MNNDSPKVKFLLLSMLVVGGRFYDVYTTYLYTPDLVKETNIVVKYLGAGWTGVILFQCLLVAFTVYCLYYYLFKFRPLVPPGTHLSLKEYTSYLYFENTTSFDKIFYQVPKNKKALLASIGFVVSMTLIATSLVVGTSTVLLLNSRKYREIYSMGVPTVLYAVIILLAVFFTIRFYREEYRKYLVVRSMN